METTQLETKQKLFSSQTLFFENILFVWVQFFMTILCLGDNPAKKSYDG